MAVPRTHSDPAEPPRPARRSKRGAAPAAIPAKRRDGDGSSARGGAKDDLDSRGATAVATPAVTAPRPRAPGRADLPQLRRDLLVLVGERYPAAAPEAVGRAFDLAVEAHGLQRRASGEPYVTHPIA